MNDHLLHIPITRPDENHLELTSVKKSELHCSGRGSERDGGGELLLEEHHRLRSGGAALQEEEESHTGQW